MHKKLIKNDLHLWFEHHQKFEDYRSVKNFILRETWNKHERLVQIRRRGAREKNGSNTHGNSMMRWYFSSPSFPYILFIYNNTSTLLLFTSLPHIYTHPMIAYIHTWWRWSKGGGQDKILTVVGRGRILSSCKAFSKRSYPYIYRIPSWCNWRKNLITTHLHKISHAVNLIYRGSTPTILRRRYSLTRL